MTKLNIGKNEIIHFIGIGGIGMSGLAQIMKTMGLNIQGSDLTKNKNIENCKKLGIKIFYGQKKNNILKASIIVKSSAIKKNNVEIIEAKKRKIPIFERVEMLANIVSLKKNIIISGSHGKTTTTSLVGKILTSSKIDPTIINGGVINSLRSNAKLGKSEWTVLEADESDGSFLKLPINYSIVTNIDYEHLDYYKNFQNLKKSFIKFIDKTPPIGKSFICIDDITIKNLISKLSTKNYVTYGLNPKADYQIKNIKYEKEKTKFDLIIRNLNGKKKIIKNIILKLNGEYNVKNATAAISICLNLGVTINVIKKALKNFSGVQRRMTKIFTKNKNLFFDDYAHHPTEIQSVLDGLRKISNKKKIITIFQPHRFSRVKQLKFKFANSFKKSDLVILCPIYSAGERVDKSYNNINFAKMISDNSKVQVILIEKMEELVNFLKKSLVSDEIIIGMGAGSISNWMRNLQNYL